MSSDIHIATSEEEGIQHAMAALIDRSDGTDPTAREALKLRRQSVNPRGWMLQVRGVEIFVADDLERGQPWAELGERADRALQRCTGEFACDHHEGTVGCDVSWRVKA